MSTLAQDFIEVRCVGTKQRLPGILGDMVVCNEVLIYLPRGWAASKELLEDAEPSGEHAVIDCHSCGHRTELQVWRTA